MTEQRQCIVCGALLASPKTGRPPRYCSSTCRRSAEYSLKRVNTRLLHLETRRDQLRRRLATGKLLVKYRRQLEQEVESLDNDCKRYEDELRALIGQGA